MKITINPQKKDYLNSFRILMEGNSAHFSLQIQRSEAFILIFSTNYCQQRA